MMLSRSPPRRLAAAAALAVLLAGDIPGVAAPPTPAEVESAVRKLGDDRFEAREQASVFLWAAGAAAEGPLRQALQSDDPEVVTRAREILERFKYGIFPDTPPRLVELLTRYRSGEEGDRPQIAQELAAQGASAHAALLRLYANEDNPGVRSALRGLLARMAPDIVPNLLAEGKDASAEDLLEESAVTQGEPGKRSYAAYLLLRGRLDDAIARYRDLVKKTADAQRARILATLLRTRGDLAGARAAAETSGDAALVESLLFEQGDWNELARRLEARLPAAPDIESLGFQAAFQRLSGRVDAFEKTLEQIRRYADGRPNENWFVAEAFFLNDRPQEAISTFLKTARPSIAFEILCAQLRYREAFALAESAREQKSPDLPSLNLQLALALQHLGESQKASAILREGCAAAAEQRDWDFLSLWITSSARGGTDDSALELVSRWLPDLPDHDKRRWLLSRLFDKDEEHTGRWWTFLCGRAPGQDALVTLKQLRRILRPRGPDPDLPVWLHEAEGAAKKEGPNQRVKWLEALANACLDAGRDDLARPYLEQWAEAAPSALPRGRLGDIGVRQKRWEEAAEQYGRAWEAARTQAVPLYLQGWALTQAGRMKEGQAKMELAGLLPLGDDARRHALAEALAEHGLKEAAAREREILLRTGEFQSWHHDDAVRKLANDALARKDYGEGILLWDRFLLNGLRTNTAFAKAPAYLQVPAYVHRHRAQAQLARNDVNGALRETDLALAAVPGDVEVPIALMPELVRRGRNQEADALFARVFDPLDDVCRAYPRSAATHNQIAWLAARCRRRMDAALAHAREAVALASAEAPYIDTLAETHFQRGEIERAVERMKRCIELDPAEGYYRRQLTRFQAGNPDTSPE